MPCKASSESENEGFCTAISQGTDRRSESSACSLCSSAERGVSSAALSSGAALGLCCAASGSETSGAVSSAAASVCACSAFVSALSVCAGACAAEVGCGSAALSSGAALPAAGSAEETSGGRASAFSPSSGPFVSCSSSPGCAGVISASAAEGSAQKRREYPSYSALICGSACCAENEYATAPAVF